MQQQQLDEDSLNRLIELLNESQIPDNAKQQEVHQVPIYPFQSNLLDF